MDISTTRDLLVVIATIVSAIGLFFKGTNNFLLELVRSKYKLIPAKPIIFDTIIKTIFLSLVSCEIIYLLYIALRGIIDLLCITLMEINGIHNNIKWYPGRIDFSSAGIVGIIVSIMFIYIIWCSVILFGKTYENIIKKIECVYYGRETSKNIKEAITKITKYNMGNRVLSLVVMGCCLWGIFILIESSNKDGIISSIAVMTVLLSIMTICFVLTFNISESLILLSNKYRYCLITKSKMNITTGLFLDYGEYYLYFSKDCERYINKNEIIEIKKERSEP